MPTGLPIRSGWMTSAGSRLLPGATPFSGPFQQPGARLRPPMGTAYRGVPTQPSGPRSAQPSGPPLTQPPPTPLGRPVSPFNPIRPNSKLFAPGSNAYEAAAARGTAATSLSRITIAAQQDTLYKPENFVFATSHNGLMTTLYFQDRDGNQGRLQTTSLGLLTQINLVERNTERLYLPSPSDRDRFLQELAATNGSRAEVERLKQSYMYCGWPKPGWYVVEVTFDGPDRSKKYTGIRSSDARVLSVQDNDALQSKVNEMYRDMKAAGAKRFSL